MSPRPRSPLIVAPATPDRWPDIERLFGPRGARGGGWCMLWRLPPALYRAGKTGDGAGNQAAFRALVEGGAEPGLLGYQGGMPVGWCAVAPRADYPALVRSRVLAPTDDADVWSVSCLFVRRDSRRQGMSTAMIAAAVAHAARGGARVVEGYPIDPRGPAVPDAFAWTGLVSAFRQAGFVEVARRSPARPIMRFTIPAADQ